ncbi:uncharacterized protein LOC129950660 [Eupeodes corollae]|uniref:uncharacterized protein LOC129950660 n=1 Tax=Eupeodes corollae TaxID=290404 RepID=UPI0024905718|nr:uncharacterized protein LOC129950660 [Eupeodes corollae]
MVDDRVSIPKLNSTNWQIWKIRVESFLARDDLSKYIEEDIPATDDLKDAAWKTGDRKTKGTIILFLGDNQLSLVKNCVHAKHVWDALRNHHERVSRSTRVALLKRLCSARLQENGNVEKHLSDIEEIFDRLAAAGHVLDTVTSRFACLGS